MASSTSSQRKRLCALAFDKTRNNLLARADLGLRRIAGPADPAVVLHWAHTSEMADPYPYLLGGELLMTAGVLLGGGLLALTDRKRRS